MNLKLKPFYLDDDAISWVQETLSHLTLDEKIGQLFLPIGYSTEPEYLDHFFQTRRGQRRSQYLSLYARKQ